MSAQCHPKRESAPKRVARREYRSAQGRPKRESAPQRVARRAVE
jgi:hypothetical protein